MSGMSELIPLVCLAAIFAVILGALWYLKQRPWQLDASRTGLTRSRRLELSPQHALHVVQFHGQELLVATYPGGCVLLRAVGGAPPPAGDSQAMAAAAAAVPLGVVEPSAAAGNRPPGGRLDAAPGPQEPRRAILARFRRPSLWPNLEAPARPEGRP